MEQFVSVFSCPEVSPQRRQTVCFFTAEIDTVSCTTFNAVSPVCFEGLIVHTCAYLSAAVLQSKLVLQSGSVSAHRFMLLGFDVGL